MGQTVLPERGCPGSAYEKCDIAAVAVGGYTGSPTRGRHVDGASRLQPRRWLVAARTVRLDDEAEAARTQIREATGCRFRRPLFTSSSISPPAAYSWQTTTRFEVIMSVHV